MIFYVWFSGLDRINSTNQFYPVNQFFRLKPTRPRTGIPTVAGYPRAKQTCITRLRPARPLKPSLCDGLGWLAVPRVITSPKTVKDNADTCRREDLDDLSCRQGYIINPYHKRSK